MRMKKFASLQPKRLASMFTLATIGMALSLPALANNVAIWDAQEAIKNSNYAKSKIASIEASVRPKQQQLQTYKANVDRLQQQYNNQKASLTDAQKNDIRQQIETNLRNYEQVAGQIQSTLTANQTDILQKITPKMQSITESIVRQKNIDLLIDNSDHMVTYVKPEWDVTADFTQKINEQVR